MTEKIALTAAVLIFGLQLWSCSSDSDAQTDSGNQTNLTARTSGASDAPPDTLIVQAEAALGQVYQRLMEWKGQATKLSPSVRTKAEQALHELETNYDMTRKSLQNLKMADEETRNPRELTLNMALQEMDDALGRVKDIL